jgi:hypothetical protein
MTRPCVRHTDIVRNSSALDSPLIVETAPTWVPWAVLGILALAGLATLGLRTTHDALSRDSVLGGAQATPAETPYSSAPRVESLVELQVQLLDADPADRS